MGDLTKAEIENWSERIDQMGHEGMVRLHRSAPTGHPVFDTKYPLYEQFESRLASFGGITPEISKRVGWNFGWDYE